MSFEINLSEQAKIVLLDLILDQSVEAQEKVKDMMGEAFEDWLLQKLGKQIEEDVQEKVPESEPQPETETPEEVPLDPAE